MKQTVVMLAGALSLLAVDPGPEPPPVVPVEPLASCDDIQARIDTALRGGTGVVQLPKDARCRSGPLTIGNGENLTLDGNGATLIFGEAGQADLSIVNASQQIQVLNLKIDHDPLPFTQGRVTALLGRAATFSVDPGYPDLGAIADRDRAYLYDGASGLLKDGVSTVYLDGSQFNGEGRRATVTLPLRYLGKVGLGDRFVIAGRGPPAVRIVGTTGNVTIEGVTIHSARGMGVFTRFTSGDNRFQARVTPGPAPTDGPPRLLSTNTDGFNYAYARRGPTVVDSLFAQQGDDGINLHGLVLGIERLVDPRTAIAVRTYGNGASFASIMRPGDPVRALREHSFTLARMTTLEAIRVLPDVAVGDVSALERLYPRARVGAAKQVTRFEVRFAEPIPADARYLDFPAVAAPNYRITGTTFENSRGHAVVSGASHGLIEGNIVNSLSQNAFVIGPNYDPWREGSWVSDVTVRGNRISDTCRDPYTLTGPEAWARGAITVGARRELAGESEPGFDRVEVVDNQISAGPCKPVEVLIGVE